MPNANILLVDDQPANLLALEAIVEGLGETFIRAHSGEEALRLADQEVAVILLDVQMHGLDGYETAKLIRSRKAAFKGLAVASSTGVCAHAVRQRAAVAVHDFNAESAWQPFGKCVAAYGLRSGWSIPIISSSGGILGTFAQYYRHTGDPTPRDWELFDMVLHTAAITIEHKRAEESLREADRHKTEFLAMLAHELHNPLAPIRNAVQIMRLSREDPQVLDSIIEMMERQVGQMSRLVDDLLDVNRISRGKIELRRRRIELASAANHAVEASRALYKSMDHELTVTLPPQPIQLNADPTRIAQVIGNLLNNACKFTGRVRQAEIEDLHAAFFALQPDVGRLDVPVDQTAFVGGRQALGHFPADAQHFRQRQLALALKAVVQRLAFEELHGQEGDAAVLADLVDGDDVIVLEGGRRPGLAQETLLGRVAGGQAGQHGLQGDETLQLGILGLEDDAHAAGSEHLKNTVGTEPAQLVGSL